MGLKHSKKKNPKVILLGLDQSGKSRLLYELDSENKSGDACFNGVPTIGFNVEVVTHNKWKMEIWEVGGLYNIRPLWKHYYPMTDAIIFMIDSTDKKRFYNDKYQGDNVKYWLLKHVLEDITIKDDKRIPIAILANKQDLPNAMDAYTIAFELGLWKKLDPSLFYKWFDIQCSAFKFNIPHSIVDIIIAYVYLIQNELNGRKIEIFECSALTRTGITDALDWLVKQLDFKR
eukprot:139079_1